MKKIDNQYKSRFKLSPLSNSLDFVTSPIFKTRGFAQNKILTEWSLIVGVELANYSSPKKLTFAKNNKYGAMLHVEVYNSGKAMEFSYNSSIIIEKIAMYFGYKAVSQIKIIQKPSNELAKETQKPLIEIKHHYNEATLQNLICDIDDDNLKECLVQFGLNIQAD